MSDPEIRSAFEDAQDQNDEKETADDLARELQSHSSQIVFAAALRVEREIQKQLWELGGPGAVITPLSHARSYWSAQSQAHKAIFAKTASRKAAKGIQRRAAGGRPPLTVCCGHVIRRLPEPVLRYNAPDLLEHYGENIVPLGSGDGCGTIIHDSAADRAPKVYCDRCAKRAGKTMNAGLAKHALAQLRASRKH